MTFLLDVNILFILHQPRHDDYKIASQWFNGVSRDGFATCAMTQAGMLRLLTRRIDDLDRFPMHEAREALRHLAKRPDHVFWMEAPPCLDLTEPLFRRMQGHRQITDAYLLGLARHHHGKLATMDKAIRSLAGPEYGDFVELVA
ncbi:MAG TPA: TA system VapC family ribonuclease toxin [Terracidiphilus sp.]|nr:TA system VapC family ribonuclease toxin [Terracidiphilus sp.]